MEDYGPIRALYYDANAVGSQWGGLEFYTGRAMLMLGCGTGRIVLPIAQTGITVTGLDISPRTT